MANNSLKNLNFTFSYRAAPKQGPTSSYKWNDSFKEIAIDLASLSKEWNNKLIKVLGALPYGEYDTGIDALTLGLDGKNLWVDHTLTSSSEDLTYYDSTNTRPKTVQEALDDLHLRITAAIEQLQEDIVDSGEGLTTTQKARIGMNIFDATQTSSSTSLDGKSENNRLNITQIAKDMYGATYTLDNDALANLTYSVKEQVDALLQIHNGSWNSDIVVDHTGISVTITQADINSSAPGDDSFVGAPTNLEEDLDQIRTEIKTSKGTADWQTALTALYAGGANSLEDLLVSTQGTGTKAAGNPWGYNIADMDDLATAASLINTTVVGSGLPTDLPVDSIQDILAWAVSASSRISGQYFRRMETGCYGAGPFTVYHGRGSYPIVQLVQVSPTVTLSGQFGYTVEHTNTNEFVLDLTSPADAFLASGVIVSIW